MMRLKIYAILLFFFSLTLSVFSQDDQVNTWQKIKIDFDTELNSKYPKGRWDTTDGYSDNVHRAKTSSVIIRTGVNSEEHGLKPGYYTNTSVEWDLATDTVKIIDVTPWGGGSYGGGQLLEGYKENIAPSPRHTYGAICYDSKKDHMWMILGANWKIKSGNASEEAISELSKDYDRTWCYSFNDKKWMVTEDSVKKVYNNVGPYENHMIFWPSQNKLLFLSSEAKSYSHFDLEQKKWSKAELKNKSPMSLYNARSAWDSKRNLWIFRLGVSVCTFNPETGLFAELPKCYDLKIPTKEELEEMKAKNIERDPRFASKGICYNSKHDVYIVSGPTGNDTVYFDPEKNIWTPILAGDLKMENGYMQYDEKLDIVILSYQLNCYKLKFKPKKPE